MTEYRAHVDFTIRLADGGELAGHGFPLDLPSADLNEEAIAVLLVRHLGLPLGAAVRLDGLRITEEPHPGRDGVPASTRGDAHRIVDLSHRIRAGMTTYPGLPAPVIRPYLTRGASRAVYAPGTEFAMDVIELIGNTGTYLDSPFHRYADGADLASLDLATLIGLPAEVVHLDGADRRDIGPGAFAGRELRGAAVLLHTGWDRHFGTVEYGRGAPFLTEEGARAAVERGAALVGIDSVNIDDTESGGTRPAHTVLLAAGVHVVEHLTNLAALPARGAHFTAAPPAIESFGTFPVRAFAQLPA